MAVTVPELKGVMAPKKNPISMLFTIVENLKWKPAALKIVWILSESKNHHKHNNKIAKEIHPGLIETHRMA
jgi:hypothetical protein